MRDGRGGRVGDGDAWRSRELPFAGAVPGSLRPSRLADVALALSTAASTAAATAFFAGAAAWYQGDELVRTDLAMGSLALVVLLGWSVVAGRRPFDARRATRALLAATLVVVLGWPLVLLPFQPDVARGLTRLAVLLPLVVLGTFGAWMSACAAFVAPRAVQAWLASRSVLRGDLGHALALAVPLVLAAPFTVARRFEAYRSPAGSTAVVQLVARAAVAAALVGLAVLVARVLARRRDLAAIREGRWKGLRVLDDPGARRVVGKTATTYRDGADVEQVVAWIDRAVPLDERGAVLWSLDELRRLFAEPVAPALLGIVGTWVGVAGTLHADLEAGTAALTLLALAVPAWVRWGASPRWASLWATLGFVAATFGLFQALYVLSKPVPVVLVAVGAQTVFLAPATVVAALAAKAPALGPERARLDAYQLAFLGAATLFVVALSSVAEGQAWPALFALVPSIAGGILLGLRARAQAAFRLRVAAGEVPGLELRKGDDETAIARADERDEVEVVLERAR